METVELNPRQTQSGNGSAIPRVARKRFDPTQLFAQRDRLPWFWFFVAVVVAVLAALDRYHIIEQFKQRERVVIIDPSQTYYISPLLQFSEAKDLHAQQAELAAVTFLDRNPKDFDHPDLLRQIFLKSALQKAQDHRAREGVEFRAKQLHQKPEIAKIDILATRENEVLVAVFGQVIRTGIFQEKAFTEAFNFKLSLRLLRNPNMAANGRFPTAVGDFNMKSPISILFLAATVALAEPPEAIQRVTLDERVVVTVPVATNRVTTISFPGPIAAIDAVGVTADGKTPGQFQLAHTKGSSFVSVRALARKTATNLNIRWNKRTYVFELIESDAPVLALNLEDRVTTETVQPAPVVTPTRLLTLLDKAKAFPLLKKQQPEAVAGAEARAFGDKPQVTDFNDYEIRIEEVFRFNAEDTLVFHVTLRNKSGNEIRYLPESFCVRVGNRLYYQSISDAPGVLPVNSASTVYFAITGTPDGGRNEISLKNEFAVLVSRLPDRLTSSITPQSSVTAQPSITPQPSIGITPENETLVRQALRRAIADSENKAGRSVLSPTNSPTTKTPAKP